VGGCSGGREKRNDTKEKKNDEIGKETASLRFTLRYVKALKLGHTEKKSAAARKLNKLAYPCEESFVLGLFLILPFEATQNNLDNLCGALYFYKGFIVDFRGIPSNNNRNPFREPSSIRWKSKQFWKDYQ